MFSLHIFVKEKVRANVSNAIYFFDVLQTCVIHFNDFNSIVEEIHERKLLVVGDLEKSNGGNNVAIKDKSLKMCRALRKME